MQQAMHAECVVLVALTVGANMYMCEVMQYESIQTHHAIEGRHMNGCVCE